jgi:hypothetical protein
MAISDYDAPAPQAPKPDPALKRLDRFVGTWRMEGHLVGPSENNIRGQASYRWLLPRTWRRLRCHIGERSTTIP